MSDEDYPPRPTVTVRLGIGPQPNVEVFRTHENKVTGLLNQALQKPMMNLYKNYGRDTRFRPGMAFGVQKFEREFNVVVPYTLRANSLLDILTTRMLAESLVEKAGGFLPFYGYSSSEETLESDESTALPGDLQSLEARIAALEAEQLRLASAMQQRESEAEEMSDALARSAAQPKEGTPMPERRTKTVGAKALTRNSPMGYQEVVAKYGGRRRDKEDEGDIADVSDPHREDRRRRLKERLAALKGPYAFPK